MIEINLLKQGHGILYRQKYIERNIAHRRAKIFLLLILLLSSLIVYLTPAKPSNFGKFIIAKLFDHLDIVWFEENVLSLKDNILIKELKENTSGIAGKIFPEKKGVKEEAFYVRVSSTLSSEEADAIQKDLLTKGFQSDQGIYRERTEKFLVVINLAKTQESAESVLKKINIPEVTWEIQKSENKEIEIISPSSFSLDKAEQIKALIIKKGFKAEITKINIPVVFHEVLVGQFKDKERALPVLNKLRRAAIQGRIVKR